MQLAIGYVRVSTSKQADSGLSIEAQRAHITSHCESSGLSLLEIYEDAGVSGSCPVADRPGLMQALARAREIGATQLVVAKLDRLSRSPFVLLTLEAETKRAGLRLTSAAGEGTEDDDPASVLVRRMLQAVAEHELAMISARTKAALAQKKARGERLGRPPYGFSVQQGDLVPNDSFPMLYEAYRLRSRGLTMRAIVDRMMLIDPDGGWNLKRVHSLSNRWKRNELEDWNVWYGNYGSS